MYCCHCETDRETAYHPQVGTWCVVCMRTLVYADDRAKRDRRKLLKIAVRDQWVCQLCGNPVNPDANPKKSSRASVDHIKPRSKGGRSTYDNLRLAHQSCNGKRGVKKPYVIVKGD